MALEPRPDSPRALARSRTLSPDPRGRRLAAGTLACPECDAPVTLTRSGGTSPAEPLACPFCGHDARVRDFLSLGAPTRATHVSVWLKG